MPNSSLVHKNNLTGSKIPVDHKEAVTDTNWKQEMDDEMAALQRNKRWELVELPTGTRTVGCKWFLR